LPDRGEDDSRASWIKRWMAHSALYSFSVTLSTVFYQTYAIRVLGFDVVGLGNLTLLNLAAIALGNLVGPWIVYSNRSRRATIWKVFAAANLLCWGSVGFSDLVGGYMLYILVFAAQLSGAVGGLASSDTVADAVPKEVSVKVFSRLSVFSTAANFAALTFSTILFTTQGYRVVSYRVVYSASLASAAASLTVLATLKDLNPKSSEKTSIKILVQGYRAILKDGGKKGYLVFTLLVTATTSLPGALWNYYILKVFGGNETWISVNNIASTLGSTVGSYLFSKFVAHRFEARRVLYTSTIPISAVPLIFLVSPTMLSQALMNFYSGLAWSAYNILVGVYNLYLPREGERLYLISLMGVLNNAAAAASTRLGASIASISLTAMQLVFVASGLGRLTGFVYGRKKLPAL